MEAARACARKIAILLQNAAHEYPADHGSPGVSDRWSDRLSDKCLDKAWTSSRILGHRITFIEGWPID